ncbi:alpha/beta hydrolase [Dactylosporangium sp. CA-092794]|uniref:alpha/beta hydrolase n=1 Tax=Dactylosporangium sp. CA-092794 TaxID=3239929 RepID=UPI003D8B69F1
MRFVTGVLCLLLLSACAKAPVKAAPPPAPSPADRLCADPELNDKQVAFAGQDGTYLAAYLLGGGRAQVTLVLAPQASATGCSWLGWAKREADAGYRVLAFDFHGEGRSGRPGAATNSGDVAAAAAFARAKGGRDVVLVGASRGGTASLVAAAGLEPPPAAVISLSAPDRYAGENALPAVPKINAPVLYVAATGDSQYAASARALSDATPAANRTLTLVPGSLHGTALLTIAADGAAEAGRAVDDFLAIHARPA